MNAEGMKIGDAVEFLSDRQTEKGPSAGRVIERSHKTVTIEHSDHPGECFAAAKLSVERLSKHYMDGAPLWMLH